MSTKDPTTRERRFGRYVVEEKIGEGGMGAVYRARQVDLDRHVVVKILAPAVARDPVAVARLQREARAAAKISSEHVVQVIEAGVEGGVPFIAMELVDGPSASKLLEQRGKLTPKEATRIVRDVARALRAAHEQGILHRDVKPSNVLVTRDGLVKLADFGICKVEKKPGSPLDGPGNSTLSLAGEILGSPDYMAPEQAEGAELDARADLYSLGVSYYQLLTGVLPFHGNTALATIAQALGAPLVPPSQHVPSLPKAAVEACVALMARSRDARPRDARAAVELLDGVLAGMSAGATGALAVGAQGAKSPARATGPAPSAAAPALPGGRESATLAPRATAPPRGESGTRAPAHLEGAKALAAKPAPERTAGGRGVQLVAAGVLAAGLLGGVVLGLTRPIQVKGPERPERDPVAAAPTPSPARPVPVPLEQPKPLPDPVAVEPARVVSAVGAEPSVVTIRAEVTPAPKDREAVAREALAVIHQTPFLKREPGLQDLAHLHAGTKAAAVAKAELTAVAATLKLKTELATPARLDKNVVIPALKRYETTIAAAVPHLEEPLAASLKLLPDQLKTLLMAAMEPAAGDEGSLLERIAASTAPGGDARRVPATVYAALLEVSLPDSLRALAVHPAVANALKAYSVPYPVVVTEPPRPRSRPNGKPLIPGWLKRPGR